MYHENRFTYDGILPELYTFYVDDSNKATELNLAWDLQTTYHKYDRNLGPTRRSRTRRYTTTYSCTRSLKTRYFLKREKEKKLKLLVQIYVAVLRRDRFQREVALETCRIFIRCFLRTKTILLVLPKVQKYISLRTIVI